MRTINLKFSGMGGRFIEEDNFIINILKKRYNVQLSDNPDFLIYSVNSKDYLKYNCVRIFYTAENVVPDFNICDYAIGFHYIDFGDRYFRYPLYLVDGFNAYKGDNYALDLFRAIHKHENITETIKGKTDFCAFVYSNSDAVPCRQMFFDELCKYKLVNSGGRFLNNIGGPIDDKLSFQMKHKFVMAFENTSTPGYTTEKIVHAFSAGAIPIYWGDPQITDVFNSSSFINCNAIPSMGDKEIIHKLISKIEEIDNDDKLYIKMLETPAFVETYSIEEQQQCFQQYLFNIFDQDKEEAYRRNRYLWGERYERKQKIGNEFYYFCRKGMPIKNALKKLLRK